MKSLPRLILISAAIAVSGNAMYAQQRPSPFSFGAGYTGDVVNNLHGGIKTGSAYLGMATMTLGLDTRKAGLWRGGEFFILGANTHGDSPSATLIGDRQTVSNIEAGNHTYLQELWYRQSLGRVSLTAGLQDMAVEFGSVEYGALYLNSSFGVKSSISHNIPVPIFPLTNLGLTLRWDISDRFSWAAAAYDGNPAPFETNPHNVKWEFAGGDGWLGVTEVRFDTPSDRLPGTYKLGVLLHDQPKQEGAGRQQIVSLYGNANQPLWTSGERSVGVFAQFGYSPSEASVCARYFGAGVNYTGLLSARGRDEMGLAVASEHFRGGLKNETAIELTYRYRLTDNLFFQPDLQYILNPAGTGVNLDDSFCINLRVGLSF